MPSGNAIKTTLIKYKVRFEELLEETLGLLNMGLDLGLHNIWFARTHTHKHIAMSQHPRIKSVNDEPNMEDIKNEWANEAICAVVLLFFPIALASMGFH